MLDRRVDGPGTAALRGRTPGARTDLHRPVRQAWIGRPLPRRDRRPAGEVAVSGDPDQQAGANPPARPDGRQRLLMTPAEVDRLLTQARRRFHHDAPPPDPAPPGCIPLPRARELVLSPARWPWG